MNNKDLKNTITLPKTDFSLKVKDENTKKIFYFWENEKIYYSILESNENKNGNFIIHDGPAYANGPIHIGHVLNRVLKDITLRFYSSIGFQTRFSLGWDAHGLPIESKVLEVLKNEKNNSEKNIRRECFKYALKQIEIQKSQLKELGLLTDYNSHYSTQDKDYESIQIKTLSELVKKGFVYRGLRPIYWSWSNKTALAENEIEYFDKVDHSIFFKIRIKNEFFDEKNVNLIVWTTQPWTIPGNMMIAVKNDSKYLLVKIFDENLIFAEIFLKKVKEWYPNKTITVIKTFEGSFLNGLKYYHPYNFKKKDFFIVDGSEIVSEIEGTGVLHVAPACGPEDFFLAKRENIEIDHIIDENGHFLKNFFVDDLAGLFYEKANNWIICNLSERKMIILSSKFSHSFPHDWRDKSPLVYRLTEQWFIDLKSSRNRILDNIEKVEWLPSHSKEKMISFIINRDDWCISRQRKWGVPIPSININGKFILFPEIIDYVSEYFKQNGSDVWFKNEMKDELKARFSDILVDEFSLGNDTLDVWFDSGVSNLSFLEKSNNWPADLYFEGKDQFRGWFNSSLIISTLIKDNPPYKKVISHGFTVDDEGRKLSKSLGNAIDPLKVIKEFGIDTIRLWVCSVDFTKETKISNDILKGINDSYQKIRNTLRFIIGNLNVSSEKLNDDEIKKERLSDIDYYIISKVWKLVLESKDFYLDYKFSNVYNSLNSFFVNELSSLYFEVIKDSLYCDSMENKRRKQIVYTLDFVLQCLLKVICPLVPFLAEECYQNANEENYSDFFKKKSVHLLGFPSYPSFISSLSINKIEVEFEKNFLRLRKEIFKCLEKARKENVIEVNSQAKVFIKISDQYQLNYLNFLFNELKDLLLVSEVYIEKFDQFSINIEKTQNEKCVRCWKFNVKKKDFLCKRCSFFI